VLTALVKLVLRAVHTIPAESKRRGNRNGKQNEGRDTRANNDGRQFCRVVLARVLHRATSPVIVGRHGDPTAVKGIE